MLDHDAGPCLAGDGEGDIAGMVLAEIVDGAPLGIGPGLHGRDRRQFARRRGFVRHEDAGVERQHLGARRHLLLEPGVVLLAEIDARLAHRQFAADPAGIGDKQEIGAVGVGSQFGDRGDVLAPDVEQRHLAPHHL